jgi:hypothetical protein
MALDANQVKKRIYDAAAQALKAQDAGAASSPQPTVRLTAAQIWKRVYDASTGKIRTCNP